MKKLILLLFIVGCEEPEDCAGVVGGTAVEDNCGICDGIDGYLAGSCYDCAGTANGTAVEDCAGVCGGNTNPKVCNACNSGIFDCEGICDGDSLEGCAGRSRRLND